MKAIIFIILHFFGNVFIGFPFIHLLGHRSINALRITQAFVIGMLFETSLSFCLILLQVPEIYSILLLCLFSIIYFTYSFFIKKAPFYAWDKLIIKRPSPGISFLIFLISLKIGSVFYAALKLPLYFDDAMTHWSGRARVLFKKINWSIDPVNSNFLGKQFGNDEYPLFSVIWRSNTAIMNGSWNDIIAKADGPIFFLISLISSYYISKKLGAKTWVALSIVLIVSSIPLEFFHAFSGYSEITVQALILLFIISLLSKEWIMAGLMSCALAYTKNEGLLLYLPIFSFLIAWQILRLNFDFKTKIKSFISYLLAAILLISPWLIFKYQNGIPFSAPVAVENYFHPGSVELFFNAIFNSASSSIYWIFCLFFITIRFSAVMKNHNLQMMGVLLLFTLSLYLYVFCFTGAYIFLINQMTIHRSLLQIAPVVILLAAGTLPQLNLAKKIIA